MVHNLKFKIELEKILNVLLIKVKRPLSMSFLQINIPSLCESKALESIGTRPMKNISSLIKVASYVNLLRKIGA